MHGNDLAFVRQTMGLLETAGIRTWLFGGWAEELLDLSPPRQHHDVDLLYPAADFAVADAFLPACQDMSEITAKHLAHKRAFVRNSIMTELILVRPAPGRGYVTDFGSRLRFRWPDNLLATRADGLRVASAEALRSYRAQHGLIRAAISAGPLTSQLP